MSKKHCRRRLLIAATVGVSAATAGQALAEPFTVSYTDGGSWNTLYAQGFSPSLAPNPIPTLAPTDTVLLDQFQFFKSGNADSASNIRLAILNNIYTNLQGLSTSSTSFVGLSTNTVASTSALATGEAITFDFDNLALTYGGEYGAVFVNVGAAGELTPVLVSALHANYVDIGGGNWRPQTNYGTESQYQFATSNFTTTNQFGTFFNGFDYAGDANFVASLLTPTVGGSSWSAGGSGAWSTPENWLGGVPNAAGAAVTFGSAASAPATVTVDINVSAGSIAFDHEHAYTIAGANSLTLDASSGSAVISVASGNHAIEAPLVLADPTTITVTPAGSTLTLAALASSTVNVTKDGAGTLLVNNVRSSGLAVNDGTMRVATTGGAAGGVSVVDSVTIAAGGKLDLTDNKLITKSVAGVAIDGAYNGLQGEVQRAYNFGSWDAPGLTTSQADALAGIATIGVATGEQIRGLGPTDTDVWAGQTINGASTIAMYTYAGDANLDGQVDAGDYGILDAYIQIAGATGYGNGDFNYDGFIDPADYGTIDNSIQFQGPPIPTSGPAGVFAATAVPEPAGIAALVVVAAASFVRRRRRRARR